MCRACYTLELGALCSKPQAAAWVETRYPAWKPMIERALAWLADHTPDDVADTLAFLREALRLAQPYCQPE
jgi:hypothetical protein